MDSLNDLVAQTQALSGRREDLALLLGLLQSKGAELLARSSQGGLERALAALDPAAHSLSFLFLLDALSSTLQRLAFPGSASASGPSTSAAAAASSSSSAAAAASSGPAEQLISSCTSFISLCSAPQIRMDPLKFVGLCRRLKDVLLKLGAQGHAIRGVLPLRTALRKLQPTEEHLTPLHADFLQLCLLARCHAAGHHILCRPSSSTSSSTSTSGSGSGSGAGSLECMETEQLLSEVDPQETGITQTDFLLFCYYGGMVCIGVKKLHQASRLLLQAITAPAGGLSAITVAAYNKFLLLSLILHGRMPALPRFTPSCNQRHMKQFVHEYADLADAYCHRDAKELQSLVTKHQDVYSKDGNLGLAKQVVASVFKRSIQRLTQTYLTLSLQDIAQTVSLSSAKDAERHILHMIEAGEIHASISQKDGMVSFKEDPERYNSYRMAQQLNTHITRTMQLGRKLEEMENSIACDRLYLQRMHLREKTGRFVEPEELEFGPSRMFDS